MIEPRRDDFLRAEPPAEVREPELVALVVGTSFSKYLSNGLSNVMLSAVLSTAVVDGDLRESAPLTAVGPDSNEGAGPVSMVSSGVSSSNSPRAKESRNHPVMKS